MKNWLASFSTLLIPSLLVVGYISNAQAQITTNLSALPHSAAHKAPSKKPTAPPSHDNTAEAPLPAPTPLGYTRIPTVPQEAPKPEVITPPSFPVIQHPPVPAQIVTPTEGAKSSTQALGSDNLRILFGENEALMDKKTIRAIRNYAHSMAPRLTIRLLLRSYAAVPGDDISMPRRIALARALAVRSLLIHGGIATTRIYPIAQGRPDAGDTAPVNRLDIKAEANTAPVPAQGSPSEGTPAP